MRLTLLLSPGYGNIFESMTVLMSYVHVTILRLYVCVHLCHVVMFRSTNCWSEMTVVKTIHIVQTTVIYDVTTIVSIVGLHVVWYMMTTSSFAIFI